jgi:hypothetical protein
MLRMSGAVPPVLLMFVCCVKGQLSFIAYNSQMRNVEMGK